VVISNVPGPPVPLYMAGAKMITNYPTSIIVHGMGLNITVQSYHHSLDFGLMADASAMPDVRELADAISIAFDDLRLLPLPGELETDEPPAEGLVSKTRRRVTDAVKGAVAGAMKSAMKSSMKGAVQSAVKRAVNSGTAQTTKKPMTATPKVRGKTRAVAPIKAAKPG
jgi:diacylglycerol O-acyltransferase / wax synthase